MRILEVIGGLVVAFLIYRGVVSFLASQARLRAAARTIGHERGVEGDGSQGS